MGEVYRLGKEKKYGIKWEIGNNDDLGQRCFGAYGLNATIGIGSINGYSDFDLIYPWSEMRRCNIKTNENGADIVTFEGETGFSLDGSNGDVFVRIPKFYYERYRKDGYEYHIVSEFGTNIHPAFIENGKELDAIFISAFEGYYDGEKLRSIEGVIPTNNTTGVDFLTYAIANGTNYTLYDMRTVSVVWVLMAIEYGCRNSNRILGYGASRYIQPRNEVSLLSVEQNLSTNQIKIPKLGTTKRSGMPVGTNITICKGDQQNILIQSKIISVEDTVDDMYTIITFDGDPIDIDTDCFVGSAPLNTNFIENCSVPLLWHTGRADFIEGSVMMNPIRYRWIENIFGNLWHFLPDITFNNLQMYICRNMQSYSFGKYTEEYKPIGGILPLNDDNGVADDSPGYNYWIDDLINDSFSADVLFGHSFDKSLISTQSFGAYYYLDTGLRIVVNGGGFDHHYRSNVLTNRAWVDLSQRWYLYGARLLFKKID